MPAICALTGLLWLTPAPAAAQAGFDRAYLDRVINHVLETERSNAEVAWSNDRADARGTVLVERTFYLDPETPCRDYVWTRRSADGSRLRGQGTGCRTSAGRWELDEEEPVAEAAAPAPPPTPRTEPSTSDAACACPPPTPEASSEQAPFADYTLPEHATY